MILSITVINYLGDRLTLDLTRPEESGFVVKSVTGLDPGSAEVNITEVSTNDGGLFNSARQSSREIVITLGFLWQGSIESVRHKSYKYFPIKKKLTLLIKTESREAEIEGYTESNEINMFTKEQTSDITIKCPNPFFYSTRTDLTVFSGIASEFEFPFMNNSLSENLIELASIQNHTEQVVIYNGDSEVGVTITIHAIGTATNISIYNLQTRESMSIDTDKLETLTGFGIINGDDIVISTVKGSKSITLIRSGTKTNILNCLDRNSKWFQLSKGDNVFAYTAETGSSNLQFKLENRVVYEGV